MRGVAHSRWKELQSVPDKLMPERKVRIEAGVCHLSNCNFRPYNSRVIIKITKEIRFTRPVEILAKHHRVSIHSIYILIMYSLEHSYIANVPAQGPTITVFMGPRASCEGPRCIA